MRIIRFAAALAMMLTALPLLSEAGCISSGITVYAAEKLAAPANFKAAETTKTTVRLTWSKVKGADAYRVYMYNSESDEYEIYKTVTGTSCEVKFLTAGHKYKFKVAALKKNGKKYSVQTKSSPLTVKTKSNTSSSPKPSQKPGEFKAPDFGQGHKKVLKECGIGNYTSEKDSYGTTYTGTIYFADIKSHIYLTFNDNDELYAYSVYVPMSYITYESMRDTMISELGKDYKLETTDDGDLKYIWIIPPVTCYIKYDSTYNETTVFMGNWEYNNT